MRDRYHISIESFIDRSEDDMALRCFNWQVDVYIFTDQLSKAMAAKWSKVNYLLGVDPVCQTNVTAKLQKEVLP